MLAAVRASSLHGSKLGPLGTPPLSQHATIGAIVTNTNDPPTGLAGTYSHSERIRQRTDLIGLDQHCIGSIGRDRLFKTIELRTEEIVYSPYKASEGSSAGPLSWRRSRSRAFLAATTRRGS